LASPKGEPDSRPLRFYREADAVALEAGGWGVALDARRLRTPAGAVLALPTFALADLIADEWRRQDKRIHVAGMTATRLANAAIDRTPSLRETMAEEAARYAGTDLVCYLAERPEALRRQQEDVWTPLRNWFAEEVGALLIPVEGLMPALQPPASLDAVRRRTGELSDFEATAVLHLIGLLGSAVLGHALAVGRITVAEAHAAARVDEDFQASQWGEDAEAVRLAHLRLEEIDLTTRWLAALRDPTGPAR
jgi:chaperone required for assembly of F1-ATPase